MSNIDKIVSQANVEHANEAIKIIITNGLNAEEVAKKAGVSPEELGRILISKPEDVSVASMLSVLNAIDMLQLEKKSNEDGIEIRN